MEQKFQSGIVKNVQNPTCQSQENIIVHGASHAQQKNVPSVTLLSLWARRERLTPGWTLVFRHYSLQNSKRMKSFSKELTQPQ